MSTRDFDIVYSLTDLKLQTVDTNINLDPKQLRKVQKRLTKRKMKKLKTIRIFQDNYNENQIQQKFTIIKRQKNVIDKNLIIKSLSSHFVFSTLIDDQILKDKLIDSFQLCKVNQGEYLIKQYDNANNFFILHDGKLILQIDGQYQRKILPGQCFGQLALLYSAPRAASIKAQKNSFLWFIDRSTFKNAIEQNIKKNYQQNRIHIEQCQFFENLTRQQKQKIAQISMTQKFQKNSKLFRQGQIASSMYILKSGTLKRMVNGVNIGYYEKGQSFQQYAVLSQENTRKQTVLAKTDVEVIAISCQQIQLSLGKSLSIIFLRNQIKKQLKNHSITSKLENQYLNKIIDSFKIQDQSQGQKLIWPGLKCQQMIFFVIQGEIQSSIQTNTKLYGLQCFNNIYKEIKYDMTINFLEDGVIAWTTLKQIQENLGKSIQECLYSSIEHKKIKIQRVSELQFIKDSAEKFELSQFQGIRKLGQGQFGTVLLVKNTQNSRFYALKCIQKRRTQKNRLQKHLQRQKQILSQATSQFIVSYIRSFKDHSYIYFLMQYINGVELLTAIRKIGILNNEQAKFYTASLIHALQSLHTSKVIYRDLKPENVMVNKDGYVKLVDFGMCKQFEGNSLNKTFTICGTPNYMAPEVIAGKGYTFTADLWSLGIILFQFLTGYVPYGELAEDPIDIYQEIMTTTLKIPPIINNTFAVSLINQLLTQTPSCRLKQSYQSLKNHKFFMNFNWLNLLNKTLDPPFIVPNQLISVEQQLNKQKTEHISIFLRDYDQNKSQKCTNKWDEFF